MTESRPARLRRPPSSRRLSIVVVLVASLMLTLFARLYYVQLLDPDKPRQSAHLTHDAAIVVPAPRGLIVDSQGRALVANTSVRQITVNHEILQRRADKGAAVLKRLAALLDTTASRLSKIITPCSPKVPAPCSTGEPFAPVVVSKNAPTEVVLAISEHRERFPGVEVVTATVPVYPNATLAAHLLGYTGQITAADKKKNPALYDVDSIGLAGLEEQYDADLRGVDGKQIVRLNPQGLTVSLGHKIAAQQGNTLVTSIDARLQRLAEQSLAQQIRDSRKAGKPAPSGAVVITDPQTGRILASASYPTYNPSVFVGGVSNADYAKLTSQRANVPLLNRATAGEYAPGSTFKLITSSSLYMNHQINLRDRYGCPGSLSIDGRVKTNFESEALGPVDLRDALGYSCDTFFYRPTADEYYADQRRIDNGKKPQEKLQAMALDYGVGSAPGLDLPAGEQSSGSYADRETRLKRWKENRVAYCTAARRGYPDVKDVKQRAYLTRLAAENCTDGYRYRAGDNADMSIGQGETTMSPLQLAMAYSALVNGGKLYEPTLGWAVVDGSGKVVRTIDPTVRRTIPVKQKLLDYIASALNFGRGYAVSGAFAYLNAKYKERIGGKTGTAEVEGKQDTSWLATWGPTYKQGGHARARFVMVGMIEQAGTGATAAGPMLKRIWDRVLGAEANRVIAGERPETTLPKIAPQQQTQTRTTGR